MILLDTNILSTFGKIDRLNLLFTVFGEEPLFITPNVFKEVRKAEERGYEYAQKVFSMIIEKKIEIISLSDEELL